MIRFMGHYDYRDHGALWGKGSWNIVMTTAWSIVMTITMDHCDERGNGEL